MAEDDEIRFRGGRQSVRDRQYGIDDRDFWRWWHKYGKKQFGRRDIANREQAEEAYELWRDEGRQRAR